MGIETKDGPVAVIRESLLSVEAPQHDAMCAFWSAAEELLRSNKEESDRISVQKIKGMNGEELILTLIYPPAGGWK